MSDMTYDGKTAKEWAGLALRATELVGNSNTIIIEGIKVIKQWQQRAEAAEAELARERAHRASQNDEWSRQQLQLERELAEARAESSTSGAEGNH